MKTTKAKVKKKPVDATQPSPLDAIRAEAARAFAQSDGRVIERNIKGLQFEIGLQEEHLAGLQASAAEVKGRIARTGARLAGLTSVLERRR